MVGTHLPPSAGSRSVGEGLAEQLQKLGFDLQLVSRRRSRMRRVADMLFTVWRARSTYDLIQLDIYSGAAFSWAEWVSTLAHRLGKPIVMVLHGGNLPAFARQHPRRITRLFSRAVRIIAPSNYLADALGSFDHDIVVIPNPLDLNGHQFRRRDKPKPRLIWLRTFHRIYDPLLAIQVLARIKSKYSDAHLTMIGPDKDGTLAKARNEAKRLGVLDQITFTGGIPKSDVPRILSTGDIFLNTTTIDNSPVSVLEAMASGLDVVSTNVGGMTYLVENERDGLLVPPGDVEAMTAAVVRLLEELGLAPRLSENGRKKAELHSWDAVLPKWEAIFAEVARDQINTHA
ncbi:MAG: glycosyltransferase family 4 protein [Gemmatimonadaceae bacterium]